MRQSGELPILFGVFDIIFYQSTLPLAKKQETAGPKENIGPQLPFWPAPFLVRVYVENGNAMERHFF